MTGIAYLLGDSLVLLFAAFAGYGLIGGGKLDSIPRFLVSIVLISMALLLLAINGLSLLHLLSPLAISLSILALAIVLGVLARKHIAAMPGALIDKFQHGLGKLSGIERLVIGFVVIASIPLLFHNIIQTTPLTYDSITYRLTRAALYLQDNTISHYDTKEDRINYLARNGDLLMMWVFGHFRASYPMVAMVQWISGLLLLLSTWGIAKQVQLNQVGRCIAVLMVPGCACVTQQMMSSQTDLLVGGLIAAALFLLLEDLRQKRVGIFPAIAIGLALGTKGSVFYYGPSLIIFALAGVWVYRTPLRQIAIHASFAVTGVLIFAGPGFWDNYQNFGNPLAPENAVELVHGGASVESDYNPIEKIALNFASLSLQPLSKENNPPLVQDITYPIAAKLVQYLPDTEKYVAFGVKRRSFLEPYLASGYVDNDTSGIPMLLVLASITGTLVVLYNLAKNRGDREKLWPAVFALFCLVAVLFFSLKSDFTLFKQRYFIGSIPLLAILAAFAFIQWRAKLQLICLALIALHSSLIYHEALFKGLRHGFGPETTASKIATTGIRIPGIFIAEQCGLDANVGLALDYNQPMAGYLRNYLDTTVKLYDHSKLGNELGQLDKWMTDQNLDILVLPPTLKATYGMVNAPLKAYYLSHKDRSFHVDLGLAVIKPKRQTKSATNGFIRETTKTILTRDQLHRQDILLDTYVADQAFTMSIQNPGTETMTGNVGIHHQDTGETQIHPLNLESGGSIEIQIEGSRFYIIRVDTSTATDGTFTPPVVKIPGVDLPYITKRL